MLVLSRKEGEKLVIGDNIELEVVRIAGNRVTLGIVAPTDVKVLRAELKPNGTNDPNSSGRNDQLPGRNRVAESGTRWPLG